MLALLLFTKVKLITFVRLVTAFTKPICSVFKSLSLDLLYNINSCVFDRLFYMKRLVTFKWSMELRVLLFDACAPNWSTKILYSFRVDWRWSFGSFEILMNIVLWQDSTNVKAKVK
jgi:hypothetical protein